MLRLTFIASYYLVQFQNCQLKVTKTKTKQLQLINYNSKPYFTVNRLIVGDSYKQMFKSTSLI